MNRKKDKEKFAELMMSLTEVFDGEKPSPAKIEIYFKSLQEFSIEDVDMAITHMINTRVYPSFPKPGEIRQEIDGDKEDRAMNAWLKVIWAVRHKGQYASVRFDDPVIHSVIEVMGGWFQFQEVGKWNDTWTQKEFVKLYGTLSHKTKHPDYLPGLIEQENLARGFVAQAEPPKPIRFKSNGEIGLIEEKPKVMQLTPRRGIQTGRGAENALKMAKFKRGGHSGKTTVVY